MSDAVPSQEEVRQQLTRVVSSRFSRKTSDPILLLTYVVEQALEGNTTFKEYDIAVAGLGKKDNFNPDADAVVFGHSHIPLHERAPDGFQIFNPGSPTERRRSPRHTMGIGRVQEGRLSFELVALD